MANPLPPGAIPKLYRNRNRDGVEVGAWYCKLQKKAVNLRTQDYFKARQRALEAVTGKRDFTDDRYFGDDGAPKMLEAVKSTGGVDDWTADAMRAAGAASAAQPDAYFAPGEKPPEEDSPAPPQDAPKVEPESPKVTQDGDSTQIPPEMMDGLIKQVANTLVELQLHGQEYLWIRMAKMNPGFVPPESDARRIPCAIWESQLKKWLPTDVPIPEWAAAIILTAFMGGTLQFQGATVIPQKPTAVPNAQP
jgi:hypothetical protein